MSFWEERYGSVSVYVGCEAYEAVEASPGASRSFSEVSAKSLNGGVLWDPFVEEVGWAGSWSMRASLSMLVSGAGSCVSAPAWVGMRAARASFRV